MKTQEFNSRMKPVNEIWAAKVLNMERTKRGADLIDAKKIVEVKFTLTLASGYRYRCWKVLKYQMDYGKGKDAYWALGTYELNAEIEDIRTKNPHRLEERVVSRTLTIVPWEWMEQFQFYQQRIETMAAGKASKLPQTKVEYEVEKGRIFITEGVDPAEFNIQTTS